MSKGLQERAIALVSAVSIAFLATALLAPAGRSTATVPPGVTIEALAQARAEYEEAFRVMVEAYTTASRIKAAKGAVLSLPAAGHYAWNAPPAPSEETVQALTLYRDDCALATDAVRAAAANARKVTPAQEWRPEWDALHSALTGLADKLSRLRAAVEARLRALRSERR